MIEIVEDVYDIASRLRSINDCYRVYYNTEKCRYEVRNSRNFTLEFVVPYDELDARTVEYARYTSVSNADMVLEDIEKNNKAIDNK